MNDRFIYDERSSRLFAPDGRFLKRLFCPKALQWNQLVADDAADRSRGCPQCEHRVFNLDAMSTVDVLREFAHSSWFKPCVYVSSGSDRVIVLKDSRAVPPVTTRATDDDGRVLIRTARSLAGINRAARMGYWPDVRLVQYRTRLLKTKMAIGQHKDTGEVTLLGDYRGLYAESVIEVRRFADYYPYFQRVPIAAYLIPRDLADMTPIVALDPIDDVVGARWNQGSAYRATRVPGLIRNRRVTLELDKVQPGEIIG